MTAVSRSDQFAKIHKVLKKHYKPSVGNAERTVVEHLIFACCLEDSHADVAEEAFAAIVHTFFDWNEIRVTSISELAEVMACLPDPRSAANRIKRLLHAIFESTFNFDLEDRRKKNLGPTVAWLEKLDGASHFMVSFVVQAALGGHAIPIDAGTMSVLRLLDVVSEKDAKAGVVPGLERAIPKTKGPEFASLLHEFGVDYAANPYSPAIRDLVAQIEPTAVSRLPKRRVERPAQKEPAKEKEKKPAKTAPSAQAKAKASPPAKSEKTEKAAEKQIPKKKAEAAPAVPVKKKAPARPEPRAKHSAPEKSSSHSHGAKKRPTSEKLAKRKPR